MTLTIAADRAVQARVALDGVSVGDAFGERFFGSAQSVSMRLQTRDLPPAPWTWTDDTAMADAVVRVLEVHQGIDCDALAEAFGRAYEADPARGYGGGAHRILQAINLGVPWSVAAADVFGGQGSMGNGGAMRSAPVGAYFADDMDAVIEHARRSAAVTHAHPDGQAGAIAVAVAAAWAAQRGEDQSSDELIGAVAARTPPGPTRDGLEHARTIPLASSVELAVAALGNGSRIISSDTVPYCVWCAARHLDDFQAAMWTTVTGLGDRDTTCAIVGGIVAMSTGVPAAWIAAREPLQAGG